MVTIKSYTNVEQSKKLAEKLPFESADMKWFIPGDNKGGFIDEVSLIKNKSEYNFFDKVTDWNYAPYVPCWSLSALLNVLPHPRLEQYNDDTWTCAIFNKDNHFIDDSYGREPVDACFEMAMKLKETDLL